MVIVDWLIWPSHTLLTHIVLCKHLQYSIPIVYSYLQFIPYYIIQYYYLLFVLLLVIPYFIFTLERRPIVLTLIMWLYCVEDDLLYEDLLYLIVNYY